jgi:hypothetical protein
MGERIQADLVAPVTSGTVSARVYLAGQDPAGLSASRPPSPRRITRSTASICRRRSEARFGPSDGEISAVRAWLTGAGLTVTKVDDRVAGYVEVSGSVQAAAQAFGVTFGTFLGPDNKADRAPEQEATVPASLAPTC